ncbi:ABC transporter permease [Burkholderia cepacia]|nr:ABC transporter permease [Burkholderia cepacia]KVW15650.1 ABC transporter permease [Burkholderia cepacia]KVZ97286.1 ABC transporter permease [Burkholderia cepacia]KWH32275.1 ABC transporter permease [Burkholderia cepacia]
MRRAAGRNTRSGPWRVVFLLLAIACVAVTILAPIFLAGANIRNLAAQAVPLLLSAVGQTLVILSGGLDLSVGSLMSLTTTMAVLDQPLWVVTLLIFTVAIAIGVANGVGVAYLNVHPIIATLSTMTILQGAALLIRPAPGGIVPARILSAVNGNLAASAWILVTILIFSLLIHRFRFGLHLFAIGGSATNALMNGVPVRRNVVLTYVLCSLLAACGGIFLAGRINAGDATVGSGFGLDSITAVAVGGTALTGGIGSLGGTVIGTALVTVIGNAMNLLNVSAFLQIVVKGLLLLAVVVPQRRKEIGL